jgi:HTH-type transcriptional regulator / antitoxin MqsA
MTQNPRNYPDTITSAESGRPMTRGEKERTITVDGRKFTYLQPGWWCSLTDPNDNEGQLVDDDNKIARMARLTAKSIARGETTFVPVVIRAIRELLGLTQREAGTLFGTGEKSFEKYESGEIQPSEPTKRLLKLAMLHPDIFSTPERGRLVIPSPADAELIRATLRKADVDRIYEGLFESQAASDLVSH